MLRFLYTDDAYIMVLPRNQYVQLPSLKRLTYYELVVFDKSVLFLARNEYVQLSSFKTKRLTYYELVVFDKSVPNPKLIVRLTYFPKL